MVLEYGDHYSHVWIPVLLTVNLHLIASQPLTLHGISVLLTVISPNINESNLQSKLPAEVLVYEQSFER